jgi:hypothetical protein
VDGETVSDPEVVDCKRPGKRRVAAGRKLGVAGNHNLVFAQVSLKCLDGVNASEMQVALNTHPDAFSRV